MTGSLQIKNGIYYAVVNYRDTDGKRKQKWKTTKLKAKGNKKKALEFLELYKMELTQQSNLDPSRICTPTVSPFFVDFLMEWLEISRHSIDEVTYAGYRQNLNKICAYFAPLRLRLNEVQPIHIQKFYQVMLNEVSANTVIHYHANIRKALQYALCMDLILTNPADKVQLPKKEHFAAGFYSREEISRLFDACSNDVLNLCIHIAAYYGLRRSEIVGLRWSAIDFEKKTLTVCHKIVEATLDGRYQMIAKDKLKNQSSRRTLPLVPVIEQLLIQELENQKNNKARLGNAYHTEYDGYIMLRPNGDLLRPNYITQHFALLLKNNGLRKIRFHDLRHSCASLLLAGQVPMKQIQEWLGHSDFSTTANIYSHLDYNSKLSSAFTIASSLEKIDVSSGF